MLISLDAFLLLVRCNSFLDSSKLSLIFFNTWVEKLKRSNFELVGTYVEGWKDFSGLRIEKFRKNA